MPKLLYEAPVFLAAVPVTESTTIVFLDIFILSFVEVSSYDNVEVYTVSKDKEFIVPIIDVLFICVSSLFPDPERRAVR
jgi:hypothetical protein